MSIVTAKDLTESDLFHIFAVEYRGDTLIVSPRGDAAGFPEPQFRSAVRTLDERLNNGRSRNLIVDLSGTDYPGLTMLAAFRDLIEAVRRRGGTAAVAGVSPETARILGEYDFGADWTTYPDVTTARKRVVHESLPSRLRRHRRAFLAVAALLFLLLVAAAVSESIDSGRGAAAHRELAEIWAEHRELSLLPIEREQRDRARARLAERAQRLAEEWEKPPLLPAASASAREMLEILRSSTQPDPRSVEFEKKLFSRLRALEASDNRFFAIDARKAWEFMD